MPIYLGDKLIYPYLGTDYIIYNTTPSIVTNGLQLYLDSAEYIGTGNSWTDLSGNNNNGILVGAPSWTSGQSGYFTLDGINDYIRIPIGLNTTAHTIQVIGMKLGSKSDDTMMSCVLTSATTSTIPYRDIAWKTVDVTTYAYATTPNTVNLINNYSINLWYNMVLTQSSGTQQGYVNGSQTITNRTSMGSSGDNDEILIGTGFWGYANMRVSIVLIYNRELSAAEITTNYNAFSGRY